MAIIHTRCPRIESPCAQLPAFAPGQKSAFCDLCQKRVHNLSAMSARERAALLAGGGPLCVRYARLIPAAALLLASQAGLAQDSEDEAPQMDIIEVTGGGIRVAMEPVFLESEVEDDAWMDPEPPAPEAP